MRGPPNAALLRRVAQFTTSSSSREGLPFILPPIDVAYDVETAERALAARGFAPATSPREGELSLVGFDIEMRPNFSGGTAKNPPALVQVANATGCVLVHLASMRPEVPPTLRAMCADARILFVGTGVAHDMQDMQRALGVECKGYVDTGAIARTFGHKKFGLKAMSSYYGYDADKPKATQTSNWERGPLDDKQIRYGAEDAALGLWVLKCMHNERGKGSELMDWVAAFANAPSADALARRARSADVPKVVADALVDYTKEERAEAREKWVLKKVHRGKKLLSRILNGNLHPVSAASSLADCFRAPRARQTSVVWHVEQPPDKSTFKATVQIGSELAGVASATSLKAAKFEAAQTALAALRSMDREKWLTKELELVCDV